jgi:hypothetical protein
MAGGVGSRLYPISTPEKPKQFLDLLGVGKTLIQLTYERFLAVDPEAHFWVVTSEAYYKYIKEQLPAIPDEQILLEPVARNTAPCIAYVSWKIAQRYPDARVMVAPSDAYVPDVEAFAVTARKALAFVKTPDQVGGDVMPDPGRVMPDPGRVMPDPGRVMPDPDRASIPYAVYNIGGGQPENLLDFVNILQEELVAAGVLPQDFDFDAHKQLVPMQPGDVPTTYADSTALERDFGFTPRITLREGLRHFARWYKEYYG